MGKIKECTDHLGNKFDSVASMCEHWGVLPNTYYERINRGCGIEGALVGGYKRGRRYTSTAVDHLGTEYENVAVMCEHWGVKVNRYQARLRQGYSVEEALTGKNIYYGKAHRRKCVDHEGNEFDTVREMLEHWQITPSLYYSRIHHGWSEQEALTGVLKDGRKKTCKDHLGNEYASITDMCKAYGVSRTTYSKLLKKGYTIEQILKKEYRRNCKICKDHLGQSYYSEHEMCRHWGVKLNTYRARIAYGYTVEQALTSEAKPHAKEITDHLGNHFESKSKMCQFWGIRLSTFNIRTNKGMSLKDALETPLRGRGKHKQAEYGK